MKTYKRSIDRPRLLHFRLFWLTILMWQSLSVLLPPDVQAQPASDPNAAPTARYVTQVKPLLRERCVACHGALKQEGGLRLDTAALAIKGGESGPAIVKRDADNSRLLVRVSAKDPADRMPPEGEGEPLDPAQISVLREWIAAGASHPQDEQPEADPRDHWAFRPLSRPLVPSVQRKDWVQNPIDAFIAHRHEQLGLTPQQSATRAVLLRRLSLDLIGLPPSPEEIAAVLADQSDDWYARAVQRLIDDPGHGERWARHWMDVWRYSDWWGLGSQLRNSQRHIWHWRDWIIESLNQDTPYDEMVRLMLAADELHPNDLDKLRATGFLARNYFLFNRSQWMHETVEHVSKSFLGLTMNCVRCHDHKYDPFPQVDYYRMRAFFEPYHARLDVVPGEPDLDRDGIPRVFDARPDNPTYLYIRGDEKHPDKSRVIAPGVPRLLALDGWSIQPVNLPPEAWQPQRRPWVVDAHIAAARTKLAAAEAALQAATKKLAEAQRVAEQNKTRTLTDSQPPKQTPPDAPATDPAAGERPQPIVADNFDTLDKRRWQLFGGEWVHSAGQLEQKLDGPKRAALRLIAKPPRDFDATVRLTILGGSRWRSVGFSFDCSAGDPTHDSVAGYHEKNVYVSAVSGGSKVHAAYNDAGRWHYPLGGAVHPMPIALNREYTLRVQVRDRVINASLNGEPVIACTAPLARREGLMQLTTFDALAAIHEVRIAPLDPKLKLRTPESTSPAAPVAESDPVLAQVEHRVAEAALKAAQAESRSVELRAKAWQAVWNEAAADVQREAHTAAVRAQRELTVAQAEHAVAVAERDAQRAASDKRDAANKALQAAKTTRDKAVSAASADVTPNDKIAEFVGAKWTPTRFASSGANDPMPKFEPTSTGRRSALAAWITDSRNPLTARVAVNHIWTRHFGTPLVSTVSDFGRKGQPPTHPELLDWLACEFIDSGWSMKHLHRLIVQSATYRLSSNVNGADGNLAKDSDNVHLWRRTPGRLESQAVRDSLLALAGLLDPTRGGRSVPAAQQADSKRRSLYFFHSNNERNLFLTMFDEALVTECYRRDQSIVPQQALAMTNSRLVLDLSKPIAERIAKHSPADDDEAFVRTAFLVLLASEPTAAELAASRRSLEAWRKLPEAGQGDAATRFAQTHLVWVLLNHNDFISVR